MRTTFTILDKLLKMVLSMAVSIPFILFPTFSFAEPTNPINPVSIQMDGNALTFKDSPFLDNSHTLVPVREMAKYLGAEVLWNHRKKTVTLKKEQQTITLKIGSTRAWLNKQAITLAQPVQLIQDKAFAPLRFIAESLKAEVEWSPSDRSIDIQLTQKISTEQAEEAVRKKLNIPQNSEILVEFDFELEEDVYVIHVYKIVDDHHAATLGWYQVDAATGTVESLF